MFVSNIAWMAKIGGKFHYIVIFALGFADQCADRVDHHFGQGDIGPNMIGRPKNRGRRCG